MTRSKASALLVLLCVILALPVRAQPQVITMQNAATATGNGTAIVVSTSSSTSGSNHGAIGVQIIEVVSGTWEITFEKTSDGTNWTAVMATNEADDTRATTATAAGHYTVVIGSAVQFRARISSYSSGTITVKGRLTQGGVAFRTTSGGGGGGSGDVVGPASATDNAVARFNLTTGKLIQNSVVTIGDTGHTTGIANLTFTGVLTGGSAPTTITDSTGKILSAALNTVQPAQGGTGITALGTGVATALGVNTGSAGAFVVLDGALGTPSSGTATNITGLPISTGVSGLGTGIATFLATPSSANLASAVTDETGSGVLVFGTSPDFTTGATIGGVAIPTISSTNTFTNKTLTASSNVLGGVTMTLGSDADGDMYYRASNVLTRLPKGTAGQVLTMNAGATAPEWATASGGGGIAVGTTTVTSGTATRLFYETAGNVVGQVSGVTSDGTNVTAGSGNLRATSPRITTEIDDTDGNPMLGFSPTAAATQYITIANNTATNAVSLTANAPTVAASAQAGTPFNLTASAATAGNVNVGAAAGGSVTITAGNAARLTSGNAVGGSINLLYGSGIGTGNSGLVAIGGTTSSQPALWASTLSGVVALVLRQADNVATGMPFFGSGSIYVNTLTSNIGTPIFLLQPTSQFIGLASGATISWAASSTDASGTKDLILRRNAAANLQLGAADAASPVAQTTSVQNVVGGTSNTAGVNWTFNASRGTGTGAGGSIIFQTAPAGGSGTTQNTLAAAFTVNGDGSVSLKSVTFANLPTQADGKLIYCSDCTIASPCASGGSGAVAKGINGAWVCN